MPQRTKVKRVGILTGGGDCPGINAVVRAVAKTAINDYSLEIVGVRDGYEGLINGDIRPLSYDDVSGILNLGGTILGTSNKANPFAYLTPGSSGAEPTDVSDCCVENARNAHLDVLICIGGDGTLTIAQGLMDKGIPVVGVPKTIDNDLYGTDVTFGFDTAVQIVTEAVDRLHTTAQSHHRVMVIETMGRYAGWLALMGGMAGGGDVILIPEIPYSLESIYKTTKRRREQKRTFSIVVVSEGVRAGSGEYIVRREVADSHEKIRLGGIGIWLAERIEEATGISSRCCVLGHLQRGGSPTARDRVLGTLFGREAMIQAMQGNFGVMVGLRGTGMVTVPLEEIAGKQRLVDPEDNLVQAARSVGTSFGNE